MKTTGAIAATAALLALAFTPASVSGQVTSNSTLPLVLDSNFNMKNDANNSFCQSYYVRVPAKTYFNFKWCQGNGNGLGIIYSEADTIAAPADGSAPTNLPVCRKVDDLRAVAYDYQFLANDMPRAKDGVNASDSFCSAPKLFPATCFNQDTIVFLSFSNYWSGQFENGTLYPSSWYGTSKARELNVTLSPASADGQPACKDVGTFTTKTKVATSTKGRMPTPKVEGADPGTGSSSPSGSAATKAPSSGATTVQFAASMVLALVAMFGGVLAML